MSQEETSISVIPVPSNKEVIVPPFAGISFSVPVISVKFVHPLKTAYDDVRALVSQPETSILVIPVYANIPEIDMVEEEINPPQSTDESALQP